MKVALDDQKQTGVFISMDELAHLDQHLAELYQFKDQLTSTSVFDLTSEQLKARLSPTIHQAVADALANGAYITYLQPDSKIPVQYINEYADGKKDFVNFDLAAFKDVVIKSTR